MFSEIVRGVIGTKARTVCIEAAHAYMDEQPGETNFKGAIIAADLYNRLRAITRVEKMLFLDDFHPEKFTLNVEAYVRELAAVGFSPDIIMRETRLEITAKNLLKSLGGLALTNEDGTIRLASPNIRLVNGDGRVTCNMLDAALYVSKLAIFEYVITVLPERAPDNSKYREQQKNVRNILKTLGYVDPPIANIFFGPDGKMHIRA